MRIIASTHRATSCTFAATFSAPGDTVLQLPAARRQLLQQRPVLPRLRPQSIQNILHSMFQRTVSQIGHGNEGADETSTATGAADWRLVTPRPGTLFRTWHRGRAKLTAFRHRHCSQVHHHAGARWRCVQLQARTVHAIQPAMIMPDNACPNG
jgi:hypothetical protein